MAAALCKRSRTSSRSWPLRSPGARGRSSANARQRGSGGQRLEYPREIEHDLELRLPVGKARHHFRGRQLLAVLLAETHFLEDQLDGRLRMFAQLGITTQELLGERAVAEVP